MKRAIEIDALADAELNEATRWASRSRRPHPAALRFFEAEADVWVVRAIGLYASSFGGS